MAAGWLRATGTIALCASSACSSDAQPAAPRVRSPESEAAPRERWPRFDEVRSLPAVNARPFATRGHLVKPSHAIVRVNPEARAEYLALVTDSVLPDGATIAMFHGNREGSELGPVYVMEKRSGTWTFVALDANGHPTAENVGVCVLCHRGGVADHVFGLPRSVADPAP
jgi:hypothetical protein